MPLKLMYITNRGDIAQIAQDAGVDRIWIDLERLGKEERQAGMNTIKSNHSVDDVRLIKSLLKQSELLVRVNPINIHSKHEIESVIQNGADIVMLPMFKTVDEVDRFVDLVSGRSKVMILVETREAAESIEEILDVKGIDEVHIGLNDLHISYCRKFMFELLVDGTISRLASVLNERGLFYGFGGIARIGYGLVPAEYIIAEHYRLGSSAAILSRSFCNADVPGNIDVIAGLFHQGIEGIRKRENEVVHFTAKQFEDNYDILKYKIEQVLLKIS